MAEANRESVGYGIETSWGTNPSGNKQLINVTSNGLVQTNDMTNSKFIRSDTNVAGTIRTGRNAGGQLGIELQYGGYDDFLSGAYRSSFGTTVNVSGTTISADGTDNSINDTAAGFTDVVEGQWIKISGFTTSGNNGYAFVKTKSSNSKLILEGITLTTEAAGATVTVKGTVMSNGTTKKSFTIEREFSDIGRYLLFTGMRVSEINMAFGTRDIAGGSVSFIGKNAASSTSSGFTGSVSASTNKSMNTVNNIKAIYIDKAVTSLDVTKFDFNISTASEGRDAIGQLDKVGIRQGTIGVSGTLGVYFEDASLLAKAYDFTAVDIAIVTEDDDGNGYIWHYPECYLNGSPENAGIDTDITVDYGFTAVLDPTLGYTCSVSRYSA